MSYKRPHDVSRASAQKSDLEPSHRKAWCGESVRQVWKGERLKGPTYPHLLKAAITKQHLAKAYEGLTRGDHYVAQYS
jgi:hypothetical protein